MLIFFIGDIVGRPGRQLVQNLLPGFRKSRQIDFVVANGENSASGKGLTPSIAEDLYTAGVDVITSGNHVWKNREIFHIIDKDPRVLRPANYPEDDSVPGQGSGLYPVAGAGCFVGVVNLIGRVNLGPMDCPFRVGRALVNDLLHETKVILVDFHAEATSEKIAMGYYLDGLASTVLGTHTHVQTADERILPNGTATLTDVGMTGPHDGVLGIRKDIILHNMITHMPVRHELAEGDMRLCGALVEVDTVTGRASAIERVCLRG
ncbi:TPA: TIGR00282 family metallophosphoesterase [Candidatus Sumerlaeota bacterium]|jgi:2',3'-cyclic-nucleotide 2'-phosphodiesterase|nr:TIGR00282 family metallophosphoesterase [Candidatus Sumerlaeota bacterium]